jgi:hypothetical protein
MLAALASLSALIEIGLFSIVWKHTTLYFWTLWSAPAWLIWYVIACHSGKWFRTAEKRLQGEEITANVFHFQIDVAGCPGPAIRSRDEFT